MDHPTLCCARSISSSWRASARVCEPEYTDKLNYSCVVSYQFRGPNAAVEQCPEGASVSNSWFSRSGAEGESGVRCSTAAFSPERSGGENGAAHRLGNAESVWSGWLGNSVNKIPTSQVIDIIPMLPPDHLGKSIEQGLI